MLPQKRFLWRLFPFSTPLMFHMLPFSSRQSIESFATLESVSLSSSQVLPAYSSTFLLESVDYVKLVQSATKTGKLNHGKLVHSHMIKTSFRPCLFLQNNLLNMYCKSGDTRSADKLFDKMSKSNIVTYNSLISGYVHMSTLDKVIILFDKARRLGLKLDKYTCAGALTACSQSGNLSAGKMIHGLILVYGLILELEPLASASYFLLYNIYMDAGNKLAASKVRMLMEDRRIKKEPGLSWIQIGDKVYSFVSGDRSHKNSEQIYAKLDEMLARTKRLDSAKDILGYKIEHNLTNVKYHSEKLAVAFGVLHLSESAPVRVMKNLRICLDCHMTMKLFSIVEKRELILKRFSSVPSFQRRVLFLWDYW